MAAFSVMAVANFNGWLRLRAVNDDAALDDGARARARARARRAARLDSTRRAAPPPAQACAPSGRS